MTPTATSTRLTADDLAGMPEQKKFELIDGGLVEKPPMGNKADWIATSLASLLAAHCQANRLGWVFGAEAGYQCFPNDPTTLRKPDVSFVRLGRFPREEIPEGYAKLAPDLAVEVISPNDLAEEVEKKVDQFLAAGVPLVWVVNPSTRSVLVHRRDGTLARLRADDELTGEDVIPGFRCRVGALFPALPAGPNA